MNRQYISEAFEQLNQMQNNKATTKKVIKEASNNRLRVVKESTTRRNLRKPLKENVPEESTRAHELIDLIVDYEDILGYATEDEKGQDVYVKYNTHTNECVVYKRDASGSPVIISFSTIPINRYKRKEKQEYIDELPATEYGKSVYR